ncbi:hypothetical protein EZV62_022190 [Acer yangbiense]|uniref:SWIM-type domain-containing protein n=1 Tax=Acer yangbiense TaxID=1000413 RepID=A0A5C7H7V5_9ROSI|nr:hypothetical protein EZV62_022190 [Acer yangbiense]
MSEFQVHVKYVDRIVDMDLIEPGDCSVISLINDTKRELSRCHIEAWETWQLRVTFPWNGQQHVLTTEKELMLCFEMFNSKHLTFIGFELLLVHINIQFPEDAHVGLLGFNQQNIGDPVEENYEEDNFVSVEENFEEDNTVEDVATDGSDGNARSADHCEGDGDERIIVVSSDEETALTRVILVLGNFIRSNRNGKAKLFKDELQERFAMKVDNQTIYRVKRIVLETLKINHIEAYVKLKRYENAILTMNPRSDVKVAMDPNMLDSPTFFRFYLSFDVCKTCFVNDCRHLIGVDGCHLFGKFGGVLLPVIALDGDNNILPIAICICEQKRCVKALAKDWPEAYTREYLTMNEKEARKLQVIHGRENWYETVDNEGVKILVNLDDAICDCRMWQMNGLPCMHAIAMFMYNR